MIKIKHNLSRNFLLSFIGIIVIGVCVLNYKETINPSFIQSRQKTEIKMLDTSLAEDWYKTWDGGSSEFGRGIAVDDDTGEIYVVGYNESINYDVILIKYNSLGEEQWNITWDDGQNEIGYDIVLDSQRNIYISGGNGTTFPNYDAMLLKFNTLGQLVWKRYYDGGSYDSSWALTIDSDDNIYMISESILISSYDTVILKYNTTGDLQWSTIFDGALYQVGHDIVLDSNNNIYIGGLEGSGPDYNYLVAKFDDQGTYLWNNTWGGADNDQGLGIALDSLNNIYITGFSQSFGVPTKEITTVKFDANGNKLWNQTWGSLYEDEGYSIAIDSAGFLYVGGYELFGDAVILKYSNEGTLIWNKTWQISPSYSHWSYDLIIDTNDQIYFTGSARFGSLYEILTVKLSIESPGGFYLWSNADNPDTDGTFNLAWSMSPRVNNYSLYYSNVSANIDIDSDTPWIQAVLINEVEISLNDGTHYFLVVAYNNYGYAISNYVSINVQIESNVTTQPGIPGFSLGVLFVIIGGIAFIKVIKYKKRIF